MLINAFLTFMIYIAAICGDTLVKSFSEHHMLAAVSDNATHAIIGGLSWTLVYMQIKNFVSAHEAVWQITLCFLISSLIDVDHFIAAKSFKLQDIHHLKSRPFLHNSTLMVLIFAIACGLSVIYKLPRLNVVSWIFFVAFVSHHTRDAARRGYWITPFGSTPPINYYIYLSISMILPYLVKYGLYFLKWEKYGQNLINLGNIHSAV